MNLPSLLYQLIQSAGIYYKWGHFSANTLVTRVIPANDLSEFAIVRKCLCYKHSQCSPEAEINPMSLLDKYFAAASHQLPGSVMRLCTSL